MNFRELNWPMPEPPKPVTLSELAELSLRACVAYATRCALRMRPRFQLPAEHPGASEQVEAVDDAIAAASAFARNMASEGHAARAADLAYVVAEATSDFTYFAAYAAAHAAQAAAHAAPVRSTASDSVVVEVVTAAYGASRVLESNTPVQHLDEVVLALRADLEKLLQLGLGGQSEVGEPIDPSEEGPLGPLWEQPPQWYNSGPSPFL